MRDNTAIAVQKLRAAARQASAAIEVFTRWRMSIQAGTVGKDDPLYAMRKLLGTVTADGNPFLAPVAREVLTLLDPPSVANADRNRTARAREREQRLSRLTTGDLLENMRRLLAEFGADDLLWAARRVVEQQEPALKHAGPNVVTFPGPKPAA